MKKLIIFFVMVLWISSLFAASPNEGCTSTIISSQASTSGRPILWKNRDTDNLTNKIIYVKDVPFSYLALTNVYDSSGRKCYAGLNSAGFGIFNTVAYNLPFDSSETMDMEGIIMADALRKCRTIADFEHYINSNMGEGLGSQANYGVFDASGEAALFEIYNHGCEKYDPSSAPEGYLVNTNYSRSGKLGKGSGHLRFDRASDLFKRFPQHKVTFEPILTDFTRDIGHVLLNYPDLDKLNTIPAGEDRWIYAGDCISRRITSAAVVMVGKKPGDSLSVATLWVMPGMPLTSIAIPLWVEAGESPQMLSGGAESELWKESLRIKELIFPFKETGKKEYMNISKLDNAAGTGFLPTLRKTEQEIISQTEKFLEKRHTKDEYALFQTQMAEKALATLREIK